MSPSPAGARSTAPLSSVRAYTPPSLLAPRTSPTWRVPPSSVARVYVTELAPAAERQTVPSSLSVIHELALA